MWTIIQNILLQFRCCFSRQAAFFWFMVIIAGMIVRLDHLGVSSFIRWLFLNPDFYGPMLDFFRSSSWSLTTVLSCWASIVVYRYPLIEFNGRILMIGDGIKNGKEARRMPGVKRLHQESQNNSKPQTILGHHHGFVGVLAGKGSKAFCVPLEGRVHEGVEGMRTDPGLGDKPATLVTRMAWLVVEKAKQTGRRCYVVLDAFFAVSPTFLIFKSVCDSAGQQLVHVITPAKDNYVACWIHPEDPEKKPRKQNWFSIKALFEDPSFFEQATIELAGKTKTVQYACLDLFWAPVKDLLRFVWVIDGERKFMLMCSDLNLAPTQIIAAYMYRIKIEVMFLALKHLLGAFAYHFWTRALPKAKTHADPLPVEEQREKAAAALEAIERFVNLAAIALGLLQYLALTFDSKVWSADKGWMRTYSSDIPSEKIVQDALRMQFFSSIGKVPDCLTLQVIKEKSRLSLWEETG